MALLSSGVALFSYRYLFGHASTPDIIATNGHFDPWIVVHATGASTALLLGPLQFLPTLRRRRGWLHRTTGRFYAVACGIGGLSALVLATGVSSGAIATLGFGGLGVAWLATTGVALRRILSGHVASHRRWMIRSFALTLAAVTLRIYLPLSGVLGFDFLDSYRATAWLCWVPNLAVAEWYLRRHRPG